jgi:hypothetical protein
MISEALKEPIPSDIDDSDNIEDEDDKDFYWRCE